MRPLVELVEAQIGRRARGVEADRDLQQAEAQRARPQRARDALRAALDLAATFVARAVVLLLLLGARALGALRRGLARAALV